MSVRVQVMISALRAALRAAFPLLVACALAPGALAQSDDTPAKSKRAKRDSATEKPEGTKDAKPKDTKAKDGKKAASQDGSGAPAGANLVATFGDWGAYTAQTGKAKICYALSEPKARAPSSLKDTKAYLFVSIRPAEKVKNELASVLNFETKDGSPASLAIGSTNYDLVTRGKNAWIKAEGDEDPVIAAMSKASGITVQATSSKGNKTTDRYSLTGFPQALDRAKRDCP